MISLTLSIPTDVESFSFNSRASHVAAFIPRFEVHVKMTLQRDVHNRGLGDIWGHGYSQDGLVEALEAAHTNMIRAWTERLNEANATPTYHTPVPIREAAPLKPVTQALLDSLELDL